MKHTFFAVGVGPGKSAFLTLEALQCLKTVPVIFYPLTDKSDEESHIALDIISEKIDLSQKKCIGCHFSMTRNEKKRSVEYQELCEKIEAELEKSDVAFITIGDVSLYSSGGRLAAILKERGCRVKFVSGITSFSLASSLCGIELAQRDEEIRIIPGDAYFKSGKIRALLLEEGCKIFMKSPLHLKEIIDEVKSLEKLEKSYLVINAGKKNEKIFLGRDLQELPDEVYEKSYMAVLIVKS